VSLPLSKISAVCVAAESDLAAERCKYGFNTEKEKTEAPLLDSCAEHTSVDALQLGCCAETLLTQPLMETNAICHAGAAAFAAKRSIGGSSAEHTSSESPLVECRAEYARSDALRLNCCAPTLLLPPPSIASTALAPNRRA
jgi:hypothetical protein